MLFENQRALRVDPTDFSAVATGLENRWSEATSAIGALESLIEGYRSVQEGPDVDVFWHRLRCWWRVSGRRFPSDDLWTEVGRVDGELTTEQVSDFSARFDDIREAEERAMSTLADVIEQAPTGSDVVLDGPAVADVIGRLVDAVKDTDVSFDVTSAEMLLADYVEDSDFDMSTIELAKRERLHAELLELETDEDSAATLA